MQTDGARFTVLTEVGANQPLSDANSASPTLGDGTANSADTGSMTAHSFLDTSISASAFDRVGFLTAGNLDVETVQFNNITVVPEPSAALLGGLGLLGLLRRRRG